MTAQCLETLRDIEMDIAVFDDYSRDRTEEVCRRFGVEFFGRQKPEGLTYSWNQAYCVFLERDYDYLIISNNDILFPKGALEELIRTLKSYPMAGLLTRKNDCPDWNRFQSAEQYSELASDFVDNPENYQQVQNHLVALNLEPISIKHLYAFCFGISRAIKVFEFQPGVLFNPANKIVGQERDLGGRIGAFAVCRKAFVYHFQGISAGRYPLNDVENRDNLFRYHKQLRWKNPVGWLIEELRYWRRKIRFLREKHGRGRGQ